jgi:hypothetical protein
VANEVLREGALGVEVIGKEEFANDLTRNSLEERNELTEGATPVARDNSRRKLGVECVVLINVPKLLRVLKVPYPYVAVLRKPGSGSGEFAVFIAISFNIRFDPLTDLGHEGANIRNRELSRRGLAVNRCLALNRFLLRQLSHLL